jgi:hypothetical protein
LRFDENYPLSKPKNILLGVTFQKKILAYFILTPDTTWWSKENYLVLGTGASKRPEIKLMQVTFHEKICQKIVFEKYILGLDYG